MTITQISHTVDQTISTAPTAPSAGDSTTFDALADPFMAYIEGMDTEYNALKTGVNDVVTDINTAITSINSTVTDIETSVTEVESYKDIAVSAANFQGNYADLTGAVSKGISVYHLSKFWALASDLADVTAKIPGTDVEWIATELTELSQNLDANDKTIANAVMKNTSGVIKDLGTLTGGTVDLDMDDGGCFKATISTATTTFTFSNPPASGTKHRFELDLTNGGSQTLIFPSGGTWRTASGSAPTLSTSGRETIIIDTDDAFTTWTGYIAGPEA